MLWRARPRPSITLTIRCAQSSMGERATIGAGMDLELGGKTALVTGGSRGIGKAIAEVLLREGASVAICARSAQTLASTAAELRRIGPAVRATVADVTDAAAV